MTTELTPETTPEFSVTVRGYDRAQVDEYIDWIREWLGNATSRMKTAEVESSQLREQLHRLQERMGEVEGELTKEAPRSIAALGERVSKILQLAEDGAAAVRSDILAEAQQVVAQARAEADELTRTTVQRQSELEGLLARASQQAHQTVQQAEARAAETLHKAESRAQETATKLVSDAEARAADREAKAEKRARDLIEKAEAERTKVLEQLAAEKARVGDQIEALVAQRDDVLSGIHKLREALQSTMSLPGGERNGSAAKQAQPAQGRTEPSQPSGDRPASRPFDVEAVEKKDGPSPDKPGQ
jgi:cell division septum initiation protein DivIVA